MSRIAWFVVGLIAGVVACFFGYRKLYSNAKKTENNEKSAKVLFTLLGDKEEAAKFNTKKEKVN